MLHSRILTQVTATEWKSFEMFLSYMPPVDDFLQEIGETIDIYDRMLIDEEIGASLEVRKKALLAYSWNISAEEDKKSQKIKQFVANALKDKITKILESLLTALEYGYAIVELIWEEKDGNWLIKDSVLLHPKRFIIRLDGKIEMISPEQKTLETKYKFIVHQNGIAPEKGQGVSVLRRCYWPWRFKRAGWQFWLTTAEKFGVPSILALIDTQGLTEAQIAERAQMIAEGLQSLKVDAAAALAGINDLKVIEARDMKGFPELIEMCNRAITKAITGQVLATGEAKHGTRAQASVHENILYEIVDSDARALSETINKTIIPWIVELNFGPDAPLPRFEFDLSEETPWERVRDAIDRGFPVSKQALYSIYGLPEPEDEEDVFVAPKSGGMILADRIDFAEDDDFFGQLPLRRKFRPIW